MKLLLIDIIETRVARNPLCAVDELLDYNNVNPLLAMLSYLNLALLEVVSRYCDEQLASATNNNDQQRAIIHICLILKQTSENLDL